MSTWRTPLRLPLRPGRSTLIAWLTRTFDRIPVKGPMVVVVAIVGAALALTLGQGSGTGCKDAGGLPQVYKPARLQVMPPLCRTIRVRVVAWRHEHDDDYHVSVKVLEETSAHSPDDSAWVNAANVKAQHGLTVVEFVPKLPRPQTWKVGMVMDLTGTKVLDHSHGQTIGGKVVYWIELHPVTAYTVVSPGGSRPNSARLAPATEG